MNKKLLTHSLRKIKDNVKRFISLFFMAFLGVGFFVGIKATSPNMMKSLDEYFDKHSVYDIEVTSTLGLTDKDIDEIKKLDGVKDVTGSYMRDDYLRMGSCESVVRILGVGSGINELYVKDGRLPKNNKEIVVEGRLLKDNDLEIGDFINVGGTNNKSDNFKIVGVVVSPLYFSMDRGMTNVGNGQIKYYVYVLDEVIKRDYYTQIYLTIDKALESVTGDKDYKAKISKVKNELRKIKDELESRRFTEVYGDKIEEAARAGVAIDTNKLPTAKIVYNDRDANQAYKDVSDASLNIARLGNVFPLVFYLIAILISLITMMRMVEEDRLENGTLKALGYNTFEILIKYILFSAIATLTGGVLGVVVGCRLIPGIIWNIYQLMFTVPYFVSEVNIGYTVIGLGIALVCIVGSAVITCIKNLKSVPATLMRPKAPKNGRRVLLEEIPFIWNKFNFSQKITVRNIFRYKSRVLATIIGITGCTALILAGFGLRDAIRDIVTYQFERVFHYDRMIVSANVAMSEKVSNTLSKRKEIDSFTPCLMRDVRIKYGKKTDNLTLVVSEDYEQLDRVISLYDVDNSKMKVYPRDNEVIITEKTRTVFGVDVGDYLKIYNGDKSYKVKVSSVVENYVGQYIYLTKNTYEDLFGEYLENTFLAKLDKTASLKSINQLDEDLLKMDEVAALVNIDETIDLVGKTMNSLNSVVVVLIVAAALLAFVVLYNLSNINISEREREIATLKVLGFYNNEIDDYITKENIILTIIGIFFGLICGKYLSNFIIATCEPDSVMFVRTISLFSYFVSAIITIVFTVIVNIITHFSLLKINMIESLKNVE